MERCLNDPERPALTERIKEIVGLGEPAYAVADRDLAVLAESRVHRLWDCSYGCRHLH